MDASSTYKKKTSKSIGLGLTDLYFQVDYSCGRCKAPNTNNTVIKFTKLPEHDFDSKVVWPQKNSYVLHPRLRRIVTLSEDDSMLTSTRSFKGELEPPRRPMPTNSTGRKIVTISEEDEKCRQQTIGTRNKNSLQRTDSRPLSSKVPRGSDVNLNPLKTSTQHSFSSSSKHYNKPDYNKPDYKASAKSIAFNNSSRRNELRNDKIKKELKNDKTTKPSAAVLESSSPTRVPPKLLALESKSRMPKEKDKSQAIKSPNLFNKRPSVSKNTAHSNLSLLDVNGNTEKRRNPNLRNSMPVIKVPLEKGTKQMKDPDVVIHVPQTDCSTEVIKKSYRDMGVGSDKEPDKVDTIIESEPVEKQHRVVQTDNFFISNHDSLIIPNVTLLKDKIDKSKDDTVELYDSSMPSLQVPELKITPQKNSETYNSELISDNKTYIIGRATLTYTTKQKIDIQLVSNENETVSSASSSPLDYPMNVVSIYKKELNRNEGDKMLREDDSKKNEVNTEQVKCKLQSIDCSYVLNNNRLVKPSELISTVGCNGLLQNDYISEQFQRELNFIDSFFESLKYLENCLVSNKSFMDTNIEHWVSKSGIAVNGPEYNSFFTKFESDANVDDTKTIASKSLCLLNLLIRDEQRRAKNLLFVLKMREDALKDFTKSQILWLENKKKQENIDIPTLKKKQRGALLKLQHECGEMERMRKALLALSEKSKIALLKTKKNIELKLKNNVVVQQMLFEKKKLKRSSSFERPALPLKCFDLSSSGCEDSITSRPKSETAVVAFNSGLDPVELTMKCAEKSIQTGESLLNPSLVDESTEMTADNYVSVDGGYLNILFHNLSLPEIFNNGKTYEVNEEALKSIVNSANKRNSSSGSEIIKKFIDQIKNHDPDRSTSPSTARSLVEEFDQYYKGLVEEDQWPIDSPERKQSHKCTSTLLLSKHTVLEACVEVATQSTDREDVDSLHVMDDTTSQASSDAPSVFESATVVSDISNIMPVADNTEVTANDTQAAPIPAPPKTTAVTDANSGFDSPPLVQAKSASSVNETDNSSNLTSIVPLSCLVLPVHCEAEELRRQQLAIEREIKALEQQQSQLLVVREIPDKPPPPYIPPAEPRAPVPSRLFTADESVTQKVEKIMTDPNSVTVDPTDQCGVFLQDFCQESIDKHKKDEGDKPWDSCNLLLQKPPLTRQELTEKISEALKEVLSGAPNVLAPSSGGGGSRRADHIDDILFAEWRSCEPQWTAHHTDEAAIKSHIFETIFQRTLTQTIDEFKKTILESRAASNTN